MAGGGRRQVPDDLSVVFRTYCSQWPVDVQRHVRPPVLEPGPAHPGDVVGRYQAALEVGDVESIVKTLALDRYFPEPIGPHYTHCGIAELRSFFTARFSTGGGVGLQHCAVTDDGVRSSSAGIAVRRSRANDHRRALDERQKRMSRSGRRMSAPRKDGSASCQPARIGLGLFSCVGGKGVRGFDEGRDDIKFLVIARSVEHDGVRGDQPPPGDRMLLGPTCPDHLLGKVGREHRVQAVVRAGVQVGELPPDQERMRGPGRQGVIKPEGPGARHGDAALALPHSRQGEHPLGQPAAQRGVRGLLVHLGVRVGRRGGGPGAGPNGQGHTDTVAADPAVRV